MLSLFVGKSHVEIKRLKFPAGETLISICDANEAQRNSDTALNALITLDFKDNNDLIDLLLLTDAIRRYYIQSVSISLSMDYLPYARQDRVCNSGESLSIKVIADLINSQNYAHVYCKDLHSEVSNALINNLHHIDLITCASGLFDLHPTAVLVSPDAGANKKVFAFAQKCGFSEVIRADKTRDIATGNIKGTVVYSSHMGFKDFLIIDDICDGGRTFVELAKELKKRTDGKIFLYVTHGIFSKGADVFNGLIDQIYTSNLMGDAHPHIKEI